MPGQVNGSETEVKKQLGFTHQLVDDPVVPALEIKEHGFIFFIVLCARVITGKSDIHPGHIGGH